jgi:hypothetical protein
MFADYMRRRGGSPKCDVNMKLMHRLKYIFYVEWKFRKRSLGVKYVTAEQLCLFRIVYLIVFDSVEMHFEIYMSC